LCANGHFNGEKNGKPFGMMLNIVQKNVDLKESDKNNGAETIGLAHRSFYRISVVIVAS
jgi:hypothetical protein